MKKLFVILFVILSFSLCFAQGNYSKAISNGGDTTFYHKTFYAYDWYYIYANNVGTGSLTFDIKIARLESDTTSYTVELEDTTGEYVSNMVVPAGQTRSVLVKKLKPSGFYISTSTVPGDTATLIIEGVKEW